MSEAKSGRSWWERSPRRLARIAGAFYLLNIVTSLVAFSGKGGQALLAVSGVVAVLAYVTVTALLYLLFRPVQSSLSLVAACFSWAGCLDGVLTSQNLLPFHIHSLVFFGFYCVLIGWLILRSAFLPHFLGVPMLVAGAGWLSFLYAPLAQALSPWHYTAGGIGEGLLTLWLLIAGVDPDRWKRQAGLDGGGAELPTR